MKDTRIERIADGLWALDDAHQGSMYLIEGDERALLIDTGMGAEPLLPVLRTLTDKPIVLALTHAHVDHMERADEFEAAYLHRDDLYAWPGRLSLLFRMGQILFRVPRKHYWAARFTPMDDGDAFDLGGYSVRVLHAPGHTPGSAIFVDDRHRALFTGDAFGSGEAAWMWLPFAQNVRRYRESLSELLPNLQPYRDYRFYGGHRLQGLPYSTSPHARLLCLRTVEDMIALCDRMLSGEEKGKASGLLPLLHLRVYAFGGASMVQRRGKIR